MKNLNVFLLLLSVAGCFATPSNNNPFDKKNDFKKKINELWQECKKNPELCSSVAVMLKLNNRNKVEWERLNNKISKLSDGQTNQDQVLKELGDELGYPLQELFCSAEGIQENIRAGTERYGKSGILNVEVNRDPNHDKEAWKKVVVAASELAIQGSGEGISQETIEKCGPVVKQALMECCKGKNPHPGVICAMNDEGDIAISALRPKKNQDH